MTKYTLYCLDGATSETFFMTIEADSEEEAIAWAYEEDYYLDTILSIEEDE